MRAFRLFMALAAVLVLGHGVALAQSLEEGGSIFGQPVAPLDLLQQGLGLLGGLQIGIHTSGVSAPSITFGSGGSTTGQGLPGAITSLFGSLPAIDLGAAPQAGLFPPNLFETLFGVLPSSGTGTGTGPAANLGSGLNSLSQAALSFTNLAQSFSSPLSNIFTPPVPGDGGASSPANIQINLPSFWPLSALQGSVSLASASTNNGAVVSLAEITFNFAR